ncbi:hypothetical protein KC852_00525 [Candidatus Nomurabacteria bacterium]|nr:hypothetical protein [Candidatus Nomurabacteria bacterium]
MAGYKRILKKHSTKVSILIFLGVGIFFLINYYLAESFSFEYDSESIKNDTAYTDDISEEEVVVPPKMAPHVETPENVRSVYMTSWVAGTKSIREPLLKFVIDSDINAIVIDIKDYSGKVSFEMDSPLVNEAGSVEKRIGDIEGIIQYLHDNGIYVIGRVTVFQDPHITKIWPSEAIKTATDTSAIWKDRKGLSFTDPGSKKIWDYHLEIAENAYSVGFDEINFDYIRFPSDGDMKNIYFPYSEGKVKHEVINSFFTYINAELEKYNPNVKTSADLFGMTTSNTDDLNIGQIIEDALTTFDYVCPMVYPSHYPATWNGYANPADNPYGVIHKSMSDGIKRAEAIGVSKDKLRAWIQDFDLGAVYTRSMVEAQIQALYDIGLYSYMVWDPSNVYTKDAFWTDLEKSLLDTEDTSLQQ